MFKIKKIIFQLLSIIYLFLTIIEIIKYIFTKSNLFGLIYLLISLFIVFLLIPTLINYKNKYSLARVSKLVIIVLVGLFNSYILKNIVITFMNYSDFSLNFSNYIFVIKNILKPILYFLILLFAFSETKILKKIVKG